VTEAIDRLRTEQINLLVHQRDDHMPAPVAAHDLVLGRLHKTESVEPGIDLSRCGLFPFAIDKIATVVAEIVDEVVTRGRHGTAEPGLCAIGILVAAFLRLDATDGQGCKRHCAREFAELYCHDSSLMIVVLRRFAVLSSA